MAFGPKMQMSQDFMNGHYFEPYFQPQGKVIYFGILNELKLTYP